jgi:hypothetical protein
MSDHQIDSTYWQGVDGKWYPPVAAVTPNKNTTKRNVSSRKTAGGIALLVLAIAVGFFVFGNQSEKKTVQVSFMLRAGYQSLTAQCVASGGYGDINSSTPVVIKGKNGKELDRSELGIGFYTPQAAGSEPRNCTWRTTLNVPDGQEYYILSIGGRGESQYTWDELDEPIRLVLGD